MGEGNPQGGGGFKKQYTMKKSRINYNQQNKNHAIENRKNPTKSESLVWNMILKNNRLWVKFMRQRMIWNYIVDFYCKDLNLVIEIDWESHNYKVSYDEKRNKYLEEKWFKVLVYTDEQVLGNLEWVAEDIKFQISKHSLLK